MFEDDDDAAARVVGAVNAAQWANMQDVFYAQTTQYVLPWSVTTLAATRVAHAPLGGLVALVRDQGVLAPVLPGQSTRMQISIYTAAGQLVESLPWDANHHIAAIAFTSTEVLAVVRSDGVVRLYHLLTPAPLHADTDPEDQDSSGADAVGAGLTGPAAVLDADFGTPRPVTSKATQYTYMVSYSLSSAWPGEKTVVDAYLHAPSHTLVLLTNSGSFYGWRLPDDAVYDALHDPDARMSPTYSSDAVNKDEHPTAGAWAYPSWPRTDPDRGPSASSEGAISSWSIAPSPAGDEQPPDVLVSPSWSNSLLRLLGSVGQGASSVPSYSQLPSSGCDDLRLANGPYHAVRASPDGSLLSLLRNDWTVEVLSSDLARGLSEYDLTPLLTLASEDQPATAPGEAHAALRQAGISQFEWCGNMVVALVLEATAQILLVGPFGETASFPFSPRLQPHIFTEPDGLRVLSPDRMDMLAMVDEGTCHIFLSGSTHPGALLYESSELFYGPSPPTGGGGAGMIVSETEAGATARVKRKIRADASIRAIQSVLPEAVQACLQAAAHAWPASLQKRLLRAAELGQTFVDSTRPGAIPAQDHDWANDDPTQGHDAVALLAIAQQLRVLNSIHRRDVALALTWEQWNHADAGVRGVMARLAGRRMHRLAVSLARALPGETEPNRLIAATAQHWARCMIASAPAAGAAATVASVGAAGRHGGPSSSPADLALAETVAARFTAEQVASSAPFAALARLAGQLGRLGLARALVRREPKAVAQVSLLLDMADAKGALKVAVHAGDPDLVQHVLRQVRRATSVAGLLAITLSAGDVGIPHTFSNTQPVLKTQSTEHGEESTQVTRLPVASALLEDYAQAEHPDMLRDLFYQDDRRVSMALLLIDEACHVSLVPGQTETSRGEAIRERGDLLQQAKASFHDDRERQAEARMTDSASKLLTVQAALERELRGESGTQVPNLVGKSVYDTMAILYLRRDTTRAERVGSTMGVPPRRQARLAVESFSAHRDWPGLVKWTLHSRRPPACGYTPSIIALLRHGQTGDLMSIIDSVPERERDTLVAALQRMPPQFSEVVEQLFVRIEERM